MIYRLYSNNMLVKRLFKNHNIKIFIELDYRNVFTHKFIVSNLDKFNKTELYFFINSSGLTDDVRVLIKKRIIKIINTYKNFSINDFQSFIDYKINLKYLNYFSNLESFVTFNVGDIGYPRICKFISAYKKYNFPEEMILKMFRQEILQQNKKLSRFIYFTFKDKIKTDMFMYLLKGD